MGADENRLRSDANWFAIWTRSRQEKQVASMLEKLDICHYLPLKQELRQWSDRKQTVSLPLFSGYLFVHMDLQTDSRLQVLKAPGVVGFVGNSAGPLPIPGSQIESIRTVLTQRMACTVLPLLREGDRVRVIRGALEGVEGLMVRTDSATRLVISIDMIHQSLAVTIAREDVELIEKHAA